MKRKNSGEQPPSIFGEKQTWGFPESVSHDDTTDYSEMYSYKSTHSDLIGRRFGRLVVQRVGPPFQSGRPGTRWVCKCDCGNLCVVSRDALAPKKQGNHKGTKSCGCLHIEASARIGKGNVERFLKKDTESRAVYAAYKKGANKRRIDFDLTYEEFISITSRLCEYCGREPSNIHKSKSTHGIDFTYNGIDRVDNDKGYVSGNVVPCCTTCNRMKSSHTVDEFVSHCHRIAKWRRST